ncbi:hypothetical protein B0H19DRAFT_1300791 [Mycena capillaripes]|nr:hypothetical protein B0H19DRAFT_1300791 [Mycena capillaripes]
MYWFWAELSSLDVGSVGLELGLGRRRRGHRRAAALLGWDASTRCRVIGPLHHLPLGLELAPTSADEPGGRRSSWCYRYYPVIVHCASLSRTISRDSCRLRASSFACSVLVPNLNPNLLLAGVYTPPRTSALRARSNRARRTFDLKTHCSCRGVVAPTPYHENAPPPRLFEATPLVHVPRTTASSENSLRVIASRAPGATLSSCEKTCQFGSVMSITTARCSHFLLVAPTPSTAPSFPALCVEALLPLLAPNHAAS